MSTLVGLNQKFETVVNSLTARMRVTSSDDFFHAQFTTHYNGDASFTVIVDLKKFPLPTVQSRLDYLEQLLKAFLSVDNVKLVMDAIEWTDTPV